MEPFDSQAIDATRLYMERGWLFYLPQADPVALRSVLEQVDDGVERPHSSTRASQNHLKSILQWFVKHTDHPSSIAPYASVKYAIEELSGTKIFLQPTDKFSMNFRSAVKYCPAVRSGSGSDKSTLPLCGVLFSRHSSGASSDAFWPVLHGMAHICLHVLPAFSERDPVNPSSDFLNRYDAWLSSGGRSEFPQLQKDRRDASQLEYEADLFAAALLLLLGAPVRRQVATVPRYDLASVFEDYAVPPAMRRRIKSVLAKADRTNIIQRERGWSSDAAFESDWLRLEPKTARTGTVDAPRIMTEAMGTSALTESDFGLILGVDRRWSAVAIAERASRQPFAPLRAMLERAMDRDIRGAFANVSLHTTTQSERHGRYEVLPFERRTKATDHRNPSRVVFNIVIPDRELGGWTHVETLSAVVQIIGIWYRWLTGQITVQSCLESGSSRLLPLRASEQRTVDAIALLALTIFRSPREFHPLNACDLEHLIGHECPLGIAAKIGTGSSLRNSLKGYLHRLVDFDPREIIPMQPTFR